MNRKQEKLLVAALAGLIIAGAAAIAVQPAMAAGYQVDGQAQVTGLNWWDHLNVRKWPASYSQKTGQLQPQQYVWIERCIVAPQGASDWCLVSSGQQYGWVNARYLTMTYGNDI
jgi:uncharacterized protein YraI